MHYFSLQDADAHINFWHFKAFDYIIITHSDLQFDLFTKNQSWSAQKILFFAKKVQHIWITFLVLLSFYKDIYNPNCSQLLGDSCSVGEYLDDAEAGTADFVPTFSYPGHLSDSCLPKWAFEIIVTL